MSGLTPAELVSVINNFYIARFTSGAAATLVLYDFLLMFEKELGTIYRSKWTIPKFLFVFLRVITPPGVIFGTMQRVDFRPSMSDKRYTFYLPPSDMHYALLTSAFAAHGLFTFRLIALYKNKRYVVWFISVFFAATYICTYGLTIASTSITKFPPFYSELFKSCIALGTSPLLPPVWYAPVAYETFIFSLTAYRAWRDAKLITGESAPFLVLFYRDGMIAFLVMTGARAWNIYIYIVQPGSSVYIGTMMLWAMNTVLTTRVYMNLVWLARKPTGASTPFTGVTIGLPNRAYESSGAESNWEMQAPGFAREEIQTDRRHRSILVARG
ncbi:hypothetical protein M408DRAFT_26272 [Serendipita vermifera MAFF 305830]|uniref:DUF6533 domain-containing protein n=1 Tax=Serendipita vermifera MAFF 305830 TaxID=933852 RepID=A0A0C3B163_SERVB|nr:hypothetical protein M408DRAFT_26272 [Serendipita vermifera MAFF 305830]